MNNLPQDESYANTAHAEAARIAFVDSILVSPHTLACIFTFLHDSSTMQASRKSDQVVLDDGEGSN